MRIKSQSELNRNVRHHIDSVCIAYNVRWESETSKSKMTLANIPKTQKPHKLTQIHSGEMEFVFLFPFSWRFGNSRIMKMPRKSERTFHMNYYKFGECVCGWSEATREGNSKSLPESLSMCFELCLTLTCSLALCAVSNQTHIHNHCHGTNVKWSM